MTLLLAILSWLFLIVAALVGAVPSPGSLVIPFNTTEVAGYDPSIEYYGYATAKIWMGRVRTNIGDVTGANLYGKIYEQILKNCYDGRDGFTFSGEGNIPTHIVHSHDKVAESTTRFYLQGEWSSNQIRKLLIGSMAGTIEALTTALSNCVDGPQGWGKFCNISDYVTVNFPAINGKRNYLHARFNGGNPNGEFRCCTSRAKVDRAIDELGGEIGSVFGQGFRRETRCIIDGWKVCTTEP